MARLDNQVPIKSTWRDAIGKKLTDRIITKRIKQGYYGYAAQQAALSKNPTSDYINRCQFEGCDETRGVKWLEFKYLPKPMFCCEQHRLVLRQRAMKNAETERQFKRNISDAMEFI